MLFQLVFVLFSLAVTTNSLCEEGEFELNDPDSLEIICKVCPDGEITGHTKKHSCQVVHDTERTCEAGTYGFKSVGCVSCPAGTHSPAGAVKVQECTSATQPHTNILTSHRIPTVPLTTQKTETKLLSTEQKPATTEQKPATTEQKPATSHNPVTKRLTDRTRNITAQTTDQTSTKVPTKIGPTLVPVPATKPTSKKGAQVALIVTLLFMLIAGTVSAAYICWRRAATVKKSKDLPLVEPTRFTVRLSRISSSSDVFEEENTSPPPPTTKHFGRQESNYVTTDELSKESEYVEARIPSKYEVLAVKASVSSEVGLAGESEYVNTGQVKSRGVARQESQYVYANPFLDEMSPTYCNTEESEYINSDPRARSTVKQPEYVIAYPAGKVPESEYVYSNQEALNDMKSEYVSSDKPGVDDKKSEYVNTGMGDNHATEQEEEESAYSYTSHGALRSFRNVSAHAAKSRGQGIGVMPDGLEYVGPTLQGAGVMPDGSEYVGPTFHGGGVMPDGSEYVGPSFDSDLYENQDGIYSQCKNPG